MATDAPTQTTQTTRTTAFTRLGIGLAQGIVMFLLQKADESKAWPATTPMLYAPLLVCALMVPMIPLAALSAMRRQALIAWSLIAAVVTAILAIHAAWAGAAPERYGAGPLSPPLFIAVAALLFIAHHLVQPAEAVRRPVAPYADYFDLVGTNAVRLFLSLAFTGAFWLLLFLAGALFKLIGVTAIQKLIGETAFAFPATGLMFAAAVHMAVQLTEARAGLALLWSTKAAAALLLSAAAALIILINAAYQDGVEPPHLILRWSARLASLLLIPIVILTAYALWLRIDQYGLTPDRILASTYLVVAAGFTVGYTLAAMKPTPWLKPLEPTNLIMAAVSVLLLIALFTPIADPARLSVGSQVKRLEAGKVAPDKFDFQFLRFDSGRYGRDGLERLKASRNANIAKRAREAVDLKARESTPPGGPDLSVMKVYPAGKVLPDSFRNQDWSKADSGAMCALSGMRCSALVMDVDDDGVEEVLLTNGASLEVMALANGQWRKVAEAFTSCDGIDVDAALKAGQARLSEPTARRDLLLGDQRLVMRPAAKGCDVKPVTPSPR